MDTVSVYLPILFFFVALIYSSVGFGGGSSYLAILVLTGSDIFLVRSTALMCNILVTLTGTIIFHRQGHLNITKALPIAVASIPMAFLGGYLPLKAPVILTLLGISLALAAMLLWLRPTDLKKNPVLNSDQYSFTGIVGGGIGLLSGMVGIGGGIFLSPLLHLVRWNDSHKIAATASFFILVNSVAGLLGQWAQNPPHVDLKWSWPFLVAVLIGGQLGSRLSVVKFRSTTIRRTTAILILIASLKIISDQLFQSDYFF